MTKSTIYIINVAVTCVTCAVLIVSCGGCTPEQQKNINDTIGVVETAAHTMPASIQSQPWYVIVLLISDIMSSVAAAWYATKTAKKEK